MSPGELSPDLYEKLLADLETRLRDYVEKGTGSKRRLLAEAEDLLGYRESFPGSFERHRRVEGLICDIIAREQQEQVFGAMASGGEGRSEAPGCLLGWLFGRRARS